MFLLNYSNFGTTWMTVYIWWLWQFSFSFSTHTDNIQDINVKVDTFIYMLRLYSPLMSCVMPQCDVFHRFPSFSYVAVCIQEHHQSLHWTPLFPVFLDIHLLDKNIFSVATNCEMRIYNRYISTLHLDKIFLPLEYDLSQNLSQYAMDIIAIRYDLKIKSRLSTSHDGSGAVD